MINTLQELFSVLGKNCQPINVNDNLKPPLQKLGHNFYQNEISHAQYCQDLFVYNNVFNRKKSGTFVEIGADDGIRYSNTYLFERNGWQGLCIEGRNSLESVLRKNRKNVIMALVDTMERDVEFQEIKGYGQGLSGIVDKYDAEHLPRIQNDIKHPDYKETIIHRRKTTRIDRIFDMCNLVVIDYLTIDIEGGEFEIIQHLLNLNKYDIKVIQIENNYHKDYETFLNSKGYKKIMKIGADEIYKLP